MGDCWVCDDCGARFEFIGYVNEDFVRCVDCEHKRDEEAAWEERREKADG